MADLCNTSCQRDAAPSGPAIAPPTHQWQRRIIRAVWRSGSSAGAGEGGGSLASNAANAVNTAHANPTNGPNTASDGAEIFCLVFLVAVPRTSVAALIIAARLLL